MSQLLTWINFRLSLKEKKRKKKKEKRKEFHNYPHV